MAAQRPVEISSPSQAIKGCEVKIASLYLALTGTLAIAAAPALGQTPSVGATKNVSRTTKAVNYRRAGAAKIDFQGTELMQQANGEARVQNKGSRTEIDAKFLGLDRSEERRVGKECRPRCAA